MTKTKKLRVLHEVYASIPRPECNNKARNLALLMIAACALFACAEQGTAVELRFAPDASSDFRAYVAMGAATWRDLGFEITGRATAPELVVDIERQPLPNGVAALSSSGQITFSPLLDPTTYEGKLALWSAAAHEFGHVLADLDHLPDDACGVMSQPACDGGHELTQDDLDLACEQGFCD